MKRSQPQNKAIHAGKSTQTLKIDNFINPGVRTGYAASPIMKAKWYKSNNNYVSPEHEGYEIKFIQKLSDRQHKVKYEIYYNGKYQAGANTLTAAQGRVKKLAKDAGTPRKAQAPEPKPTQPRPLPKDAWGIIAGQVNAGRSLAETKRELKKVKWDFELDDRSIKEAYESEKMIQINARKRMEMEHEPKKPEDRNYGKYTDKKLKEMAAFYDRNIVGMSHLDKKTTTDWIKERNKIEDEIQKRETKPKPKKKSRKKILLPGQSKSYNEGFKDADAYLKAGDEIKQHILSKREEPDQKVRDYWDGWNRAIQDAALEDTGRDRERQMAKKLAKEKPGDFEEERAEEDIGILQRATEEEFVLVDDRITFTEPVKPEFSKLSNKELERRVRSEGFILESSGYREELIDRMDKELAGANTNKKIKEIRLKYEKHLTIKDKIPRVGRETEGKVAMVISRHDDRLENNREFRSERKNAKQIVAGKLKTSDILKKDHWEKEEGRVTVDGYVDKSHVMMFSKKDFKTDTFSFKRNDDEMIFKGANEDGILFQNKETGRYTYYHPDFFYEGLVLAGEKPQFHSNGDLYPLFIKGKRGYVAIAPRIEIDDLSEVPDPLYQSAADIYA